MAQQVSTHPKMDYKTLLALTGYITQDPMEVEQQFRRMAFNYYAENFDDHARNFSFLYINGKWKLSPAYDMTHDSPLEPACLHGLFQNKSH
ncbi:MAG: HipA domain-containing protein [Hoylesella buccalis]